MKHKIPDPDADSVTPQSLRANVLFPGVSKAARDLEVTRSHLIATLKGERRSARMLRRWNAWLQLNPAYAALQRNEPGRLLADR